MRARRESRAGSGQGGGGALGRGDSAAWMNSSVARILLAAAARAGPEVSPRSCRPFLTEVSAGFPSEEQPPAP